jgi:transcriptional regulator with XRE-family HTH domain
MSRRQLYASAREAVLAAHGMRRLRMERGLSLEQAGKLLGIHKSNVLRTERGERAVLPLSKIAGAFGVTEAEVLEPCPRCRYDPPAGYLCLRCGTSREAS